MNVGYARVSKNGTVEDLQAQMSALRTHGCVEIFADHVTSARSHRPDFEHMLERIHSGDVVVSTRLDRLGCTALDTIKVLDQLTKLGVAVVTLCPALDTRTVEGQLLTSVIAHLANFDKELLHERTNAGLAAAHARGHAGGRHPSIDQERRKKLLQLVNSGVSVRHASETLEISRSHAYRIIADQRSKLPTSAN